MADHSVAADLSGDVALTSDLTGTVPIASALSGDVALASELDQDFVVTLGLSGDAVLTSDLTGSVPVAATLSGDAVIGATDATTVPVSSGLSGDAALGGELDQDFVVASALSGAASLSAIDTTAVPITATLQGEVVLAGELDQDFLVVAALTGEASLDAGLISAVPVEAILLGDASLIGTDATTVSVDISLSGTADLASVLSGSVAASASLSGDVSFEPRLLRIAPAFSRHNVVFGGTDEYLTMGDVLDKNKVDPFSISCWFKTNSASIQYLVSKFDAAPKGWGLRTNNGTLEMLLFNSGAYEVAVKTTAATFADGLWHHVVATIDGSGLASGVRLYVDNVDEPRTIVLDTLGAYDFNNLGSLNVGARTNGAVALLTGSVDDVSIWDVVLNAEAVSRVYNGGYPGDLEHHPQAADLAGWWLMGDGDTYPIILDHSTPKQRFPIVSDQGPSGYDGTATNMELADVQADVPGAYAAVFDGLNKYVRVPHNVAFSFEYNQPFSISAWVRADPSYASNRFFVTKTNLTRGWHLATYSTGVLWFQIANDGSNYVRAAASINVCDGAWHYVVGTYDGSGTAAGMQVYVDGQLATTSQSGNPLALTIATTSDVNFSGANNTNWRGGQKDISDVAIWSKTLSASEVSELYNDKRPVDHTIVASNLVGWWRIGTRFSTASNGIIDFSGNGRHGSAVSMVSTDFVRRDYGDTLSKSLLFGGTDEYVTMGNVLGFERTDAFSVSLWFKSTVSGVFLSKYNSTFRGFATYIIPTGLIDFALVSDASQRAIIRTTTAWHDGNWHHVAVVSTGTSTVAGMKIYVDGVVQTTTTIDDDLAATIVTTSNLWLGGRDVPGDNFCLVGSLDDVSVWDKALSQAEVTAVYNFGIPTDLSGSSNLVGYWPLGEAASNHYDATMVNMEAEDIVEDAPGLLTFEGAAVLNASGSLLFSVGASLSGSADFEASFEANVQVQADLSGEAVLTAMDATSVPIEASLSGDATLTSGAGVPRYSIESVTFGGTNEYIKMGNVLGFSSSDPFSICYWFKSGSSVGGGYVVTKAVAGVTGYGIYHNSTGREELRLMDGPGDETRSVSSIGINDLKWHHVVVTYDGGKRFAGIRHYIDGVLDLAPTTSYNNLSGTMLNSAEFNISGRSNGSAVLTAGVSLDEVSIWNKELSASEASEVYNGGRPANLALHSAVANLVGWWRMGEYATFPIIPDASVSGYDGTMVNMELTDITSDTPWTHLIEAAFLGDAALSGDLDQDFEVSSDLSGDAALTADARVPRYSIESVTFDGVDEYVTMGNVLGFERTDIFSISFWFKTVSGTAMSAISKMTGTSYRGYDVAFTNGTTIHFQLISTVSGNNAIRLDTPFLYNDGLWHHYVGTYDGSSSVFGVTAYVDGIPIASAAGLNNLTSTILNTANLQLGIRSGVALPAPFNGSLDEVSIWNKKLSASEAFEVYNGGRPADLALHSAVTSLVGWWRMGEYAVFPIIPGMVAGSNPYPTILDSTGHGYDGTMVGMSSASIQTVAPYGKCLTFDGVNERVTIGDVLGFERTDTFSASAWFKSTASGWRFIVGKEQGAWPYQGWGIKQEGVGGGGTPDTIRFDIVGAADTSQLTVTNTVPLRDGNWHHIVCTYDGSSSPSGMKMYVDGAPVGTTVIWNNLTTSIQTTASMQIGAMGTLDHWAGSLSDVTVWNKELSAAEAASLYNDGQLPVDMLSTSMAANLVGWWPLGEGDVHPTVYDRSVSGHNGTMVNMETSDFGDHDLNALALSQKSLYFSAQYVSMGNVLNYERTDSFSFTAWFRNTATGVQMIFGKVGPESYRGYSVYTQSGNIYVEVISSWSGNWFQVRTTGLSVTNSGWHHVAVTYDGSSSGHGCHIYVDGRQATVIVGANSLSATIITTADLRIGSRQTGSLPFYGDIDEVAFYSKVLSQVEVTAIYNLGVPTNLLALSSATDIDAWWRMGDDAPPDDGTMVNMEAGDITSDTPWTHLVEAALSGEASLNADVSGAVLVEVGLSGDSALTGTVLRAISAEAGLSGDAALTADVTVDTITLDLLGEAALSASLSAVVPAQVGLSGDAALTADVTVAAMVEAPLSGEATLEAPLLAAVPLASDLSGEAALEATLGYISLTLLETVGLSEAVVAGQTNQVALVMEGDSAFDVSALVDASVEAYLAGDAALTAVAVQDLEATLSGEASVLADILALVLVDAAFSGTATVEADATADVLLMTDFLGEATLFGEVGVHADLVSAMQGGAILVGRLSVGRSGIMSDASIIPKPSAQESAYQTKHYSIQDRRR